LLLKNQYWNILNDGVMNGVPEYVPWCLKNIQDVVAFSWLKGLVDLDIAEVGAGDSRLITLLSNSNKCSVIDEYKGVGNGPKKKLNSPNVNFIDGMVGRSEGIIDDSGFDVVFSISVVEHVPTQVLEAFFADCYRLLKSGGTMIHLIDVYVEGKEGNNSQLWSVVTEYLRCISGGLFVPVGEISINSEEDLAFSTSFATNPDSMMRQWNSTSPKLIEKRKVSQSCTLEFVLKKT
jgi:ubiquinone/menaquinone biosynthesis C-methylase UbiE